MIKLTIRKSVVVENCPFTIIRRCKKDLIFVNPVYRDANKYGRMMPLNTKPTLKFYKYSASKKQFVFPKGYLYFFKKKLEKYGEEFEIVDKTLTLPKLDFNFLGVLREYQEKAVRDCLTYPCGVLEAGTGSGKTVMALFILAKRRQPTLILVHNKELLYQWKDRIKKFLGFTPGLVGDGNFDVKDVTVGIINSIKSNADVLKGNFGHIILDEVHRCPSSLWIYALKKFPAKYALGLSATPFRRDGLGKAIYAFIGPKMHKVKTKELQKEGAVLAPKVIRVDTKARFYYKGNYSSMIKSLCRNKARNFLIAKTVMKEWNAHKANILVVSDRVSHCNLLYDEISSMGGKVKLVHGNTRPEERKKIISDVGKGKVNILIATTQLIGEGFDAPNLASLFLTTPIKFKGRLIQIIGRILRPEEGKKARVYDIVDMDIQILRYSWFAREKTYKSEWR